jgi:hypothetical protein
VLAANHRLSDFPLTMNASISKGENLGKIPLVFTNKRLVRFPKKPVIRSPSVVIVARELQNESRKGTSVVSFPVSGIQQVKNEKAAASSKA